MDAAAVQYYLNDLPKTFKRPGTGYAQWMASLGFGVSSWTEASDAVMAQVSFTQAQWGWLDVWGQLFGIPRLNEESDAGYLPRIQALLILRGATPVSIRSFMQVLYGVNCTIVEQFGSVTWLLKLNSPVPGVSYNALATALGRVRPAGVPFTPFQIAAGGCFISTVNFLGGSRVPGSWINTATTPQGFTLSAGTPNSVPLLPTSYLTDPTLNPTLGS